MSKSFVLVMMFFLASNLFSKEASNVDFLSSIVDSLLLDFVRDNIDNNAGIKIRVQAEDDRNPSNWFLQGRLVRVLQNAGNEVYLSSDTSEVSDMNERYLLKFNIIDLNIRYEALRGGPPYSARRRARTDFSLLLLDKVTGRVLWSGNLQGSKSDVIAEQAVEILENANIAFTVGTWTGKEGPKIVKPILVTSTAGIVIFLFYSFRSR